MQAPCFYAATTLGGLGAMEIEQGDNGTRSFQSLLWTPSAAARAKRGTPEAERVDVCFEAHRKEEPVSRDV